MQKENVRRDSDGLANIDDFFDSEEEFEHQNDLYEHEPEKHHQIPAEIIPASQRLKTAREEKRLARRRFIPQQRNRIQEYEEETDIPQYDNPNNQMPYDQMFEEEQGFIPTRPLARTPVTARDLNSPRRIKVTTPNGYHSENEALPRSQNASAYRNRYESNLPLRNEYPSTDYEDPQNIYDDIENESEDEEFEEQYDQENLNSQRRDSFAHQEQKMRQINDRIYSRQREDVHQQYPVVRSAQRPKSAIKPLSEAAQADYYDRRLSKPNTPFNNRSATPRKIDSVRSMKSARAYNDNRAQLEAEELEQQEFREFQAMKRANRQSVLPPQIHDEYERIEKSPLRPRSRQSYAQETVDRRKSLHSEPRRDSYISPRNRENHLDSIEIGPEEYEENYDPEDLEVENPIETLERYNIPTNYENEIDNQQTLTTKAVAVSKKSSKKSKPKKAPAVLNSKPKSQKINTGESNRSDGKKFLFPAVTDFDVDSYDHEDENGLRKSKRSKMAPLAYWKNEKVIYGRRDSGYCPVPVVKGVIRVNDDEEEKPFHKKAHRPVNNTKKTQSDMPVLNFETQEEEEQQIVVTPDMLNPQTVGAGNYRFQKVFSEGEFLASGILYLPKGANKPNKNSNASAMIFVVMAGQVEVQIHKTVFTVGTGSQFFVPRGNQYSISNGGQREARLFFCHGKPVPAEK